MVTYDDRCGCENYASPATLSWGLTSPTERNVDLLSSHTYAGIASVIAVRISQAGWH